MKRSVRWSGWLALAGFLGCSGESALVGGNYEEEGVGGSPPGAADLGGGSARRWSAFVVNDPRLCLPYELPLESDGMAACKLFMIAKAPDSCACDAPARVPASEEAQRLVRNQARASYYCDLADAPACDDLCVCENVQASGQAADACRTGETSGAEGWCYVAPDRGLGDPAVVADCTTGLRAATRFASSEGEWALLTCSDASQGALDPDAGAAPLGTVCVPSLELDPMFSGFQPEQVTVDSDSTSCASGICLVHRFGGRVTCPLGNISSGDEFDDSCVVPGSNEPVTVPVPAQLVDRPPSRGATCSCRCAGPGGGPFCQCGEGQECVPLIEELGLAGDEFAGSYCIPSGAADGAPPYNGQPSCAAAPEQCALDRPFL